MNLIPSRALVGTQVPAPRSGSATACALTLLQAASMLLAGGARAQSSVCDQLKATLAARVEATGVRGYGLETVPGGSPVPRGASVIGTCEGGKFMVLYRRWAATSTAAGASAAEPPSAPQATTAAEAPSRRAPVVAVERPVQAPPPPASTPAPEPLPVKHPVEAASAVVAPAGEPEKPPAANTREAASARPEPASAPPDAKAIDEPPAPAWQLPDVLAGNWRWIAALLLLPIAGWIWAWRAHRSAYDEAGLPRGPKL